MLDKTQLSIEIKICLDELRHAKGWTIDDLAQYLELNSLSLRNMLSRKNFSDMVVTIMKLKHAIPETLAYEYKKSTEREKILSRKKHNLKAVSA